MQMTIFQKIVRNCLKNFNPMDFFKTTRWCLAIVGHKSQDFSKGWSTWMHCLAIAFVASGNFGMISFTVTNPDKLNLATASLSVSLTNMMTCLKGATFIWKRSLFAIQMTQLRELNEKFKNLESKRRLYNALRLTESFEHKYCWLCVITGFYFCLSPCTKMAWQFITGEPVEMLLPYPVKFPFEWENSVLIYIILLFYSTAYTGFICYYVPGIDCLFYSFAINVSTHFQVLQDNIKANDFKGSNMVLNDTIAGYVKHHNLLLDLSERMRVLFKPVIIFQFLLTSLQLCLVVFQIVTNTDDFAVLLPNAGFIFVILFQLLIYCYGGEIVMHESLQMNWAVQSSQWYNLPPRLRRRMVLIMQRSQRPFVCEAGFYKATLESFMNIVQTAASYITLMQSLE